MREYSFRGRILLKMHLSNSVVPALLFKYTPPTVMFSRVWSCGSDCKRVVEAAWRGFNVHVSEGESNLEALGYGQDPLLLQVGAVGLRVLGGVDLPVHLRL